MAVLHSVAKVMHYSESPPFYLMCLGGEEVESTRPFFVRWRSSSL